MSTLISIGAIRTSFGLEGWLKLISHSGEWKHFAALKTVILEESRRDRRKSYDIEGFRMHHGGGILKLVGIDNPEMAKSLAGQVLLVPREFAAPLSSDEWYIKDLVGLSLIDADGNDIGEVLSVIETADDLLEIRRSDGSRFMLPFRKQFVGEPDLTSRTIVLLAPWLAELT